VHHPACFVVTRFSDMAAATPLKSKTKSTSPFHV
jgi:hypothetical protein